MSEDKIESQMEAIKSLLKMQNNFSYKILEELIKINQKLEVKK